MPDMCKDCLSYVIPIDENQFVCEECNVLFQKKELITKEAAKDIERVMARCRHQGGRSLKQTVTDAISSVAKERDVPRQTVHDSCTRRIGLKGQNAKGQFAEKVRHRLSPLSP